jgi:TP901 family phage tail tape measure protein
MAQYGVTARNAGEAFQYAMDRVDAWSNLAHNAMVSVQDLALGMEKTGSVANMVGVDFDNLNALLGTAVRNTGMSGENLGKGKIAA